VPIPLAKQMNRRYGPMGSGPLKRARDVTSSGATDSRSSVIFEFLQLSVRASFRKHAQQQDGSRREISCAPNVNLEAFDKLGRIYVTDRRLDEAKKNYADAACQQPRSVAAKTMVGLIMALQNKPEDRLCSQRRPAHGLGGDGIASIEFSTETVPWCSVVD
jgi:hypothetical protein